jgi:Type II CAAX prenyl endopeptidase Rce1-like
LQAITTAIRVAVLVFGISALATLANRGVANSGIIQWLLIQQKSIPGAVSFANLISTFAYGIAVLFVAYLVSRNYWRELFPDRMRWMLMGGCFAAGVLFAMFFNHPMHVFLFDFFFDQPVMRGVVSDAVTGNLFSGLRNSQVLFSLPAIATILVSPFVEELTDRGIAFKEGEGLALWQIALLSFLIFCFSHYAIGGFAKVLAVVPVAALLVATRIATGSFVYSVAAHIGVNAAALLKLQVW